VELELLWDEELVEVVAVLVSELVEGVEPPELLPEEELVEVVAVLVSELVEGVELDDEDEVAVEVGA